MKQGTISELHGKVVKDITYVTELTHRPAGSESVEIRFESGEILRIDGMDKRKLWIGWAEHANVDELHVI